MWKSFESREGGLVFDTPGFTSFDILEADEAALSDYYPEFASYKGKCRFDNCRHLKEPDCRVREAAERGEISMARYESYLTNLEQVKKRKNIKLRLMQRK